MKVDFSDVKGFEPFPAGTYPIRLTDYEIKEAGPNAKHPGSEYINTEFTVMDGAPNEAAGRKVWAIISLLPQAIFKLKELLVASGNFTEEALNSDDFDFDPETMLIGIECRGKITVKAETDEYDARNEIRKFRAMGDTSAEASSLLP